MDNHKPWLFSRVTLRLLVGTVSGFIGWFVGGLFEYPIAIGLAATLLSVMVVSVLDTLKGHEFLDWLRAPDVEPPMLPGLWGDATHRVYRMLRQRDQGLLQERQRLDHFLSGIDASPNGIILIDTHDHITWISRSAAAHFGLDPVRDIQQRITNLIRDPAFVQYLADGQFLEAVRLAQSHGSGGTLSITMHRYGDGLKMLLSQDVTERERAEAMRRDFVANVSHEIRTPLTVLHGFIETLVNLQLTEVERGRVLTLMMQQADRMQTLVSDLLVLAQIEGGPRPDSDTWCDVASLFQRLQSESVQLSKGRHQLQFEITPQDASFQVAGIESEWFSAMSNLVSNAIRYTPEGGSITVRWSVAEDGSAEFSVADTGIGIEVEHLPRLTERFYRVDGSRSRETGGTGLGLSIVKHVIQRHGGDLRVSSERGQGSNFALVVPAVRVRRGA